MTKKLLLSCTIAATAIMGTVGVAAAQDKITVAYFLEWPTPNQFAQANDLYEEAGLEINWVSFDAGTAMSAAMASGDVQIAYSQGVTPFLVATAAGQDLTAVDVAVTYSDNDNCVVRSSLEIDAGNASAELGGLEVAVPLGTAAHSGFLAQMKHFGVDPASMSIVDMAPVDSAAAFAAGELDMVCGWGGALRRMKEHGNVLLSGAEKEAVVGRVFDIVSVPTAWAEENPDILSRFLSVNAQMEQMYRENRPSMMDAIAQAAGMDVGDANAVMDVFGFPEVGSKLSDDWMSGFVAQYFADSAAALEESGQLTALDDYGPLVDASYLEAADGT